MLAHQFELRLGLVQAPDGHEALAERIAIRRIRVVLHRQLELRHRVGIALLGGEDLAQLRMQIIALRVDPQSLLVRRYRRIRIALAKLSTRHVIVSVDRGIRARRQTDGLAEARNGQLITLFGELAQALVQFTQREISQLRRFVGGAAEKCGDRGRIIGYFHSKSLQITKPLLTI